MDKNDILRLIDEIFLPLGFKRKGNNWCFDCDELLKIVNLQKSNYGNSFYINYGYVIKGLPLTTTMHVQNRLAGRDKNEDKTIVDLLDLEISLLPDLRLSLLKQILMEKVASKMDRVNTTSDLINELKERPHLNDIPLVVKDHFQLL